MSNLKNTNQLKRFIKKLKQKAEATDKKYVEALVFSEEVFSIDERASLLNKVNSTLNGFMYTTNPYDLHPLVLQKLGQIGFLKAHVQYQQVKEALFTEINSTAKTIAKELGHREEKELPSNIREKLSKDMLAELENEFTANLDTKGRHLEMLRFGLPTSSRTESNFAATGIYEEKNILTRNGVKVFLEIFHLNREFKTNLKLITQVAGTYYEVSTTRKSIHVRTVSRQYFEKKSASRRDRMHQVAPSDVRELLKALDFEKAVEKYKPFMEIVDKYHTTIFK
ncbi:hypothetical protein [Vibrio sp. D431a]|uniref:hypothetical protein n=1 Tax=Vibrio sp. D431a TaxID=2837388 RepID=UPI0025574B8D|nr:hypothetical protein [Vibrio sp. D431a]MDK9790019.1 hypothetical protein [Vibrio sp. D431a]